MFHVFTSVCVLFLALAMTACTGAVATANHSASRGLFVTELERSDGYKFTCEASAYYTQFVTKLSHWGAFFDTWSPDFIDYFTSTYENPFYYDRFQIVDGEISYERGDFWWPDYTKDRMFPERYYADTLINILDFMHYLVKSYKSFVPNIDMLVLGSEYYYLNPSWFTTDYPVFRFESSNEDWSILHWLLPTREYVQFWNMWGWEQVYKLIVEKSDETNDSQQPRERLTEAAKMAWSDKIDMVVFRGSTYFTRGIRYQLADMLVKHGYGKNGTDATKYFDFRLGYAGDMEKEPMLVANRDALFMSSEHYLKDLDQMKYKFVIIADGSCSADRVARQLIYGSVLFKQESRYKSQYFYDLVPYQHYIPWTDPEDLYNKVSFYLSILTNDNNDNNKFRRERLVRYMSYVALNGMKYALTRFDSDYMDCQAINMLHLYVNTFKKTNIEKLTLDAKIKYNQENKQRFLDNRMNKTIVLNEGDIERHPIHWPMHKMDVSVIEEINNLMNKFDVSKDDISEFNLDVNNVNGDVDTHAHVILNSMNSNGNANVSEGEKQNDQVVDMMKMNFANGFEAWQLNTPFLLASGAFAVVFIAVAVVWKNDGFAALKNWLRSKL